jgi:hypothetical protein
MNPCAYGVFVLTSHYHCSHVGEDSKEKPDDLNKGESMYNSKVEEMEQAFKNHDEARWGEETTSSRKESRKHLRALIYS